MDAIPKPPKGCKCEIKDWGNPFKIPAICLKFAPNPDYKQHCKYCEHDKECHGTKTKRRAK